MQFSNLGLIFLRNFAIDCENNRGIVYLLQKWVNSGDKSSHQVNWNFLCSTLWCWDPNSKQQNEPEATTMKMFAVNVNVTREQRLNP